jgi:hypothetical protein
MIEEKKITTIETIVGETLEVVTFHKHGEDIRHYAITRDGVYCRSKNEPAKYEPWNK